MSGYETIMVEALARLKANPPLVANKDNIRRAKRTPVTREKAPAVHLIDGPDKPKRTNACGGREGEFTISLFARDDAGLSTLDATKVEVMRRMGVAWPAGVVCYPGDIVPEAESADGDALRIDMSFRFEYGTAGEWAL